MIESRCGVCHTALATDRATCQQCGVEFHLALRVDSPVQDCGDAWIDDQLEALAFACNACLGKLRLQPAAAKRRVRSEGAGANSIARARRRSAVRR